jgi:hypothetical protein
MKELLCSISRMTSFEDFATTPPKLTSVPNRYLSFSGSEGTDQPAEPCSSRRIALQETRRSPGAPKVPTVRATGGPARVVVFPLPVGPGAELLVCNTFDEASAHRLVCRSSMGSARP